MGDGRPEPVSRVAVVVVTYQSANVVTGFLDSLPAALGDTGAHELVVVDNASSDGTLALAAERAEGVTLVARTNNDGYAAAVNAGIAAARPSRTFLVCNPDLRLQPGSVRRLLDALEGDPGVGITVPRLVDESGHLAYSLRREPTILRNLGEALLGGVRAGRFPALGEVVRDADAYGRPGSVDWATGAAMLISSDCLQVVGPWDESFFLYSEETDFALRARAAGFDIRYVPDAVAIHLGGGIGTSELWALRTVNRIRLYARSHGRWRTRAFWAASMMNEGLRALAGRPRGRVGVRALLGCRPSQARSMEASR